MADTELEAGAGAVETIEASDFQKRPAQIPPQV